MANFNDLEGKILTQIDGAEENSDYILFVCNNGDKYQLFHYQSCCEDVYLSDITGDINDLLNTPILLAEERDENDTDINWINENDYKNSSQTFTFYTIRTIKGSVDLRWYGGSNGYYSEKVDFEKIK